MKRVILFLISSLCLSPLLLSAAEAPQAKPEAKPEAAKPPAPKPPVQQKKTKAPVPREIVGRAMTEARDAFRKNSDSDAALRILDSAMEVARTDWDQEFRLSLEKALYFKTFAEGNAFLDQLLARKEVTPEQCYLIYGRKADLLRRHREKGVTQYQIWDLAVADPRMGAKELLQANLIRANAFPVPERLSFLESLNPDDESIPPQVRSSYYALLARTFLQRVNYYEEHLTPVFQKKAVEAYRKALECQSSYRNILNLAETQVLTGDLDGAEETMKEFEKIKMVPANTVPVECLRGEIAMKRGDYAAASELISKALNQEKLPANAVNHFQYFLLAKAYFGAGKYPEALSAMEMARDKIRSGYYRSLYEQYVTHLSKVIAGQDED